MKTKSAQDRGRTFNENVHAALKREYLYAKCLDEDKQLYACGNEGRLGEIVWEKDWACELALETNEGKCYVVFYN